MDKNKSLVFRVLYKKVPTTGVEPARPKRTQGPQPCASTNSATWVELWKRCPGCEIIRSINCQTATACELVRQR